MDPYPQAFPYHRDHIGYPQHYCPSWEVASPHVEADSAKVASSFGPCSYNSFNYSGPTEWNGCSSYPCTPGYYNFRPSHPIVQPPHLYYHGLYPPCPNACPAYFVPPPHYSVDQAQYHYEKPRGQHCCGCPNHTCHQKKDDKSIRIEEHKPEAVSMSVESSPLVRLPNYPYPLVWVPAGSMKDKESNKPSEPYPGAGDRWIPLGMNNIKALKQGEEEKANENEHSEGKKMQFPLPFMWIPGYNQPEVVKQDLKEIDANQKSAEELPSKFKLIPVKFHQNENRDDKPGSADNESESQAHSMAVDKESKLKSIPVKKMEESGEKKPSVGEKLNEVETGDKKFSILEQDRKNCGKNKCFDNNTKKQVPPVKSSKLPPVCLRVDPLPKRKSGNGTSRSSRSPLSLKVKEKVQQDCLVRGLGGMNESMKETLESKKTEFVKITDRAINETNKEDGKLKDGVPVNSPRVNSPRDVLGKSVEDKSKEQSGAVAASKSVSGVMKNIDKGKSDGIEGATEVPKTFEETSQTQNLEKMKKANRKIISDADAALLIQSAYRGFQVRRLDPLKKLRQVARICEQVGDVRKAVHYLETTLKQKQDDKQRVVIGETIMSLLLQLDTIQGLHPNVREIRKSVARELVLLQEKLDSLIMAKEQIEFGVTETNEVEIFDGHQQAFCSISSPMLTEPASATKESVQTSLGKDAVAKQFSEEIAARQSDSADMLLGVCEMPNFVTEVGEVPSLVPKDEVAASVFEKSKGMTLEKEKLAFEDGLLVKSQGVSEEKCCSHEQSDKPSSMEDKTAVIDEVLELPRVQDESADSGDDQLKQADPNMEDLPEVPLMKKLTLAPADVEELQPMGVLEELEPKEERSQETLQIEDTLLRVEETKHASNQQFLLSTAKDGELASQNKESSIQYVEPHSEQGEPTTMLLEEEGTGPVEELTARPGFDLSGFAGISNPDVVYPSGVVEELESKENESPVTLWIDDTLEKVEETEHASNPENFKPSTAKDGELVSVDKESLVQYDPHSEQEEPAIVSERKSNTLVEKPIGRPGVDFSGSLGILYPKVVHAADSVQVDDHDDWLELGANAKDFSVSENQDSSQISDSDAQSYGENLETAAADVCLPPIEFTSEQELRKEDEINSGPEPAVMIISLPTKPTDRNHLNVFGTELHNKEKKVVEENKELKDLLEKLLDTGKEQLAVISNLNGRVKYLERKLAQKKKLRVKWHRTVRSNCNYSSVEKAGKSAA